MSIDRGDPARLAMRDSLLAAPLDTILTLAPSDNASIVLIWRKRGVGENDCWNVHSDLNDREFPYSSDLLASAFYEMTWSLS